MTGHGDLYAAMLERGISRRTFMQFSAAMAAALALPASYAPRIAKAVAVAPRVPVIWLRGQDCGGNTTPSSCPRTCGHRLIPTCSPSIRVAQAPAGRP
jgi:Ni,Fe-hydrogenase I small subunit